MATACEVDKWEWQSLFMSERGPGPNTRLVLTVILMHMYGDETKSAFPGQETIAECSGLSSRSVRTHLMLARQSGWIRAKTNKRRGKTGVWYSYFLCVPKKLEKYTKAAKSKGSRPENPASPIQRPENPATRPENPASTTGKSCSKTVQDLPANHVLNHVSNQNLNSEQRRSVVNDVPRIGVEWAEAIGAAKDLGFRPPHRDESAKTYMTQVKQYSDRPAPASVSNRLRRKVTTDINGALKLVSK